MELTIRKADLTDAALIAEYNRAMAKETENLDLDPARVLAGVETVLSDAAKGFYVVAEDGGRVVAQVMITFEWSDWRNGQFWWFQSVYVHPEYRKQGIFRNLYAHVLEQARANPEICGVRLYVEGGNLRAQHTYESLGMNKTSYGLYEVDFTLHPATGAASS
jgi:ribosomal protein S18 acetylase RimI-like enzyme